MHRRCGRERPPCRSKRPGGGSQKAVISPQRFALRGRLRFGRNDRHFAKRAPVSRRDNHRITTREHHAPEGRWKTPPLLRRSRPNANGVKITQSRVGATQERPPWGTPQFRPYPEGVPYPPKNRARPVQAPAYHNTAK